MDRETDLIDYDLKAIVFEIIIFQNIFKSGLNVGSCFRICIRKKNDQFV